MAHEEQPIIETKITDSSKAYEEMSDFYLNQTFSDIKITVQGKTIPAHKIVLAARCKFFKNKLSKNPTISELTLPNVPSVAFLKILQYIYTGSVTIPESSEDSVFDVVHLAHEYSLNTLKEVVSKNLKSSVNLRNVGALLNKASLYGMEDLRDACMHFIDGNISKVLETDIFNTLSQKSMVSLLGRDTFPLPEIEVFNICEKWCNVNEDIDGLVVKCVRLPLISKKELLSIVRHSKIIDRENLLATLEELENGDVKVQPRVSSRLNQGIADTNYKFKVISGISGDNYVAYRISDNTGITVDLGVTRIFNHIHMKLENTSTNCGYYVNTSVDQKTWKKVVDYSKYPCRSVQNLYFDKQDARYIRIVGTFDRTCTLPYTKFWTVFCLEYLEIHFKSEAPVVVDGIVRPQTNVATVAMGATVIEGGTDELLDVNNDKTNYRLEIDSNRIIIQLAQPYLISNLKLCFDGGSLQYDDQIIIIETSQNKIDWLSAVNQKTPNYSRRQNNQFMKGPGVSSWQNYQFTERPVVFLRIRVQLTPRFKRPRKSSMEVPRSNLALLSIEVPAGKTESNQFAYKKY